MYTYSISCIFNNISRTCLAWKGLTETKKRRSTSQQPRTQSASRPVDKPLTNWLQTGYIPVTACLACFVPTSFSPELWLVWLDCGWISAFASECEQEQDILPLVLCSSLLYPSKPGKPGKNTGSRKLQAKQKYFLTWKFAWFAWILPGLPGFSADAPNRV